MITVRHLATLAILVVAGPLGGGTESPEQWYRDGRQAVQAAKRLAPISRKAKNVILFIGDGMGISTVTAARILDGQRRGDPGEENLLSFEKLPYTALIKTYASDQQTADSDATMTAMVTGVKTRSGLISVNQNAVRGDHASAVGQELTTILELAERAGLSTGVVTTTRITHATPAACYAHSPERNWEDDSDLPGAARIADYPDIARQLIEFSAGDGLEVALGGGRRHFLPVSVRDPEDEGRTGSRTDGRDLTVEWSRRPRSAYVWNKAQFEALDAAGTAHLLGLFDRSHMEYEYDRPRDVGGEPSLSEMTAKAIDLLARNPKGYVLMVEGGRIDHAHHHVDAFRALTDTIEFANAVRTSLEKTDRRETLIVVTADHSHVFTIGGYPVRGNPILGKVLENDEQGHKKQRFEKDLLGKPYTTLTYANGPFPRSAAEGRPDLTSVDTETPLYRFESAVPLVQETHGGEDVPLYADGPMAHLFRGVLEQNVIFHVMIEALGLAE